MDIKNIVRNVIPIGVGAAKESNSSAKAESKHDATNDREGNGQAAGEEQKKKKLTPEEIQEAVTYLKGLPGIKENFLAVKLETNDQITVVIIVDRDGKVVRRIPESELAALTQNREKKSGHLLNRAL